MTRVISVLVLILLLGACAGLQQTWPSGAPGRLYFLSYYQDDPGNQDRQSQQEYLEWVSRFYEGVNPFPGWLELSERVLARVEPRQRQALAGRLYRLGGKISAEWAKDNAVRVLDTRMAGVWRDALLEAQAQDDLPAYLAQVEQDVDAILQGDLEGEDIHFERYYVDEFGF